MGIIMNTPAISFHDLTLGYAKQRIIHDLTLDIPQGALMAVVGANGSGKSTLLKAIMGDLRPQSGSIRMQGFKHRDIAWLPQRAALQLDFPMNVHDCVAMGLWKQIGAFGTISGAQQDQIYTALNTVRLTDMQHVPLSSLSGGQMQRALFARLLLQDASVILLDEPFNAIDEKTINDLMLLVQQWHQEGRTVLTVLHDWELVRHYFPQVLWLANGKGGIGNSTEVLEQYFQRWVA